MLCLSLLFTVRVTPHKTLSSLKSPQSCNATSHSCTTLRPSWYCEVLNHTLGSEILAFECGFCSILSRVHLNKYNERHICSLFLYSIRNTLLWYTIEIDLLPFFFAAVNIIFSHNSSGNNYNSLFSAPVKQAITSIEIFSSKCTPPFRLFNISFFIWRKRAGKNLFSNLIRILVINSFQSSVSHKFAKSWSTLLKISKIFVKFPQKQLIWKRIILCQW